MIVIVAPEEDAHARCVAKHLDESGTRVRILDFGRFTSSANCSLSLWSQGSSKATVSFPDEDLIDLAEVDAVWYRRPRLAGALGSISFPADRAFAAAEWNAALDGLLASPGTRFVNDPWKQRGASKPCQLQVAKRAGLAVPDTLITSDAEEAKKFVSGLDGRVVHKSLTAPHGRFLATKRWSGDDAELLDDLKLAPTIFQKEIDGSLDLRITVIGRCLYAASFPTTVIHNGAESWIDNRLNVDVPYRACTLPADVAARILDMMEELGLSFGTIDMKVDAAGQYVFLEVNPQGQFLYVEVLTGLPLGRAMADLLLSPH